MPVSESEGGWTMTPNEVNEMLEKLIVKLNLPIYASNKGPQLVSDNAFRETREGMDKVIKEWMNGCGRSHSVSVGRTIPVIEKAISCLALETHRTPEIEEILESLINERSLSVEVVNRGYELAIIANDGIFYHDEDMTKLQALLKKEGLDVAVRHSGFDLRGKENNPKIQLSAAETLTEHLASALEEHGLQVNLLHQGFDLKKNQVEEIDIAEIKEITFRLEIMVGIPYVQGGYSYSNDAHNKIIHWESAQVNTAYPII